MWDACGNNLSMAEGDFGFALPFTIEDTNVSETDSIKFVFKDRINGTTVLEKDLTFDGNASQLIFTEAESALFTVGLYVYRADWYHNGLFMCNVVPIGIFKVLEKA